MSTSTYSVPPARRRALAAAMDRRAARAIGEFTAGAQALFGLGFWVAMALVMVAVPLVIDGFGGQMSRGVLEATPYSARWTAFSIGVSVMYTVLATHLATGGTRRALWLGTLLGAAGTAVVYGLLFAAAQVGERALFGALGWQWVASRGLGQVAPHRGAEHLVAEPGVAVQILANAAGEALVTGVYALVGATFVILLNRVGSLMRNLAWAVPVALALPAVEIAARSGVARELLADVADWYGAHPASPAQTSGQIGVGLLAALAVAGVTAGLLWVRLRTLQLKPPH